MTWLAQMEARRLVLSLRELLVRHDENAKAHALMQACVPFLLDDDPEIARARHDQAQMVAHLASPEAYAAYYSSNQHERPFEEQYGIQPGQAHAAIPRVAILRDTLKERPARSVLDLGCNDGWMAANLANAFHTLVYHGVDLNPDCVERARGRLVARATFAVGDLLQAREQLRLSIAQGGLSRYDVVVCFEAIEHVPGPDELLHAMAACCTPGGRLLISTPLGATEDGNLPDWWRVEPKGHVRVFTPRSFGALLERHGTLDWIKLGGDRVMVAQVTVPA